MKPASKRLGLCGIFIRSKGLKDLIADSAFKRMQVDVQGACRLDADELISALHRGQAGRPIAANGMTDDRG